MYSSKNIVAVLIQEHCRVRSVRPSSTSFVFCGKISLGLKLETLALEEIYFSIGHKTDGIHWPNNLMEYLEYYNHCKIVKQHCSKAAEVCLNICLLMYQQLVVTDLL